MAIDAYMKLEEGKHAIGVKGESQDDQFHGDDGWIRLTKVEFGAENPTDVGDMTGGGGAGKALIKEISIDKKADSSSPGMWQTCMACGHYNKATINLRKGGSDKERSGGVFMEILMLEVIVKDITWTADEDAVPTENLTLVCGAMQVTYWKQDEEGGLAKKINPAKWSQNLNIPEFKVKK